MQQTAINFMQLRGGSSKGLYFLADDLPLDEAVRNQVILTAIGRDERQIDGLGGADALTSKVAIVSPASRDDADIDFLFVQVVVGKNQVDITPNCGNILAGVGPFAIEAGLIAASEGKTFVRVHMVNSGKICELELCTPNKQMQYEGNESIDGVPGTSAPVVCNYLDVAGSICGALLPTTNLIDDIQGTLVTCIDNGMPVVMIKAQALGVTGSESPQTLNDNVPLRERLERIRIEAGQRMNLGYVTHKAIPKMCLISPAQNGGLINTRTFIPHQCHSSIGVLGAVTVATGCILPGTVASDLVHICSGQNKRISVEHPSGKFDVSLLVDEQGSLPSITKAGVLRTARLLSKGTLFVPSSLFCQEK